MHPNTSISICLSEPLGEVIFCSTAALIYSILYCTAGKSPMQKLQIIQASGSWRAIHPRQSQRVEYTSSTARYQVG